MKTTQTLLLAATLSAGLLSATGANATLVSALGGQVVNDTDLNITWLADANYAKTSGHDADGLMSWYDAIGWIATLNVSNYLGYNNWRLPTTMLPDASCGAEYGHISSGFNCTGSEMGHLFYSELGQVANQSISSSTDPDMAKFTNLQSGNYWSGTEYGAYTGYSWVFNTEVGGQGAHWHFSYNGMFALAVRDGQVATVPVPAAAWLLGSGLLGLVGVARRKTA